MVDSLWAECEGKSKVRRLSARPFRAVEAQHVIATRKLVDSDAEQQILEELLESSKPRLLRMPELARLHYLLATPFRYPPLPHGSRFGTRFELGIWYGSESERTLFAEVAYYRLLFLEGTRAPLERIILELTSFRVGVRTARGVDLVKPPFAARALRISSKTQYESSQRLGREMRAAGVEAFRFSSARDAHGTNVGVFQPGAFATTRPSGLETWLCVATRQAVEVSRKDFFRKRTFTYPREVFEIKGNLPSPSV